MSMNYKLYASSVVLLGCGLSSQVYAACAPSSGFRSQDVSMQVGRVVVRPSDPVGTVLRKATFPISSNGSRYVCDYWGGSSILARLTQNYPLHPGSDAVYTTNIEGIGIRLYREAASNNYFSGYYPYQRNLEANKNYVLDTGFFVVEIIKIAATTGSGALVPGQYSSYYLNGYPNQPFLTSTVHGNAITIASSSCEWQGAINKVVQLPSVKKSDFSGVGSTVGEQDFDLNILCNGGKNPTGYEESNVIKLSFGYTSVNGMNNVMANDAPVATRAGGVGVQLVSKYKNNNKVLSRNEKLELGTLKSNQVVQYNVPMSARYYQTAANITPGIVRSLATVTIEYE